jgi:uncharacterized protein YtpQ (UPF0354 family)
MAIEWLKKFAKGPTTSQPANDWRSEIGKADLTRQEFCSLCVDASRDLFKDATIEHGDSMEEILVRRDSGTPITIFLSNLWSKIRSLQGGRAEEIERFLGAMVRAADARPAANRDAMVPMIKDVAYLKEILANFTEDDKQTVTEHLAGDLWIVYAFDTPETIVTMQKTHLRELELNTQELRALAIENLRRILPPVLQHGDGPVYLLTAGADYVASLLLFDDVWAEIQETTAGDIVAAVPSRDVLLFTDSTSKEGIEELRASITRITNSGGYLVSSTMFRRTIEGWKPFS